MKQYILSIGLSMIVGATVYGFSSESDPYKIIERQNRESIIECTNNLDSFTGSSQKLQKELEKCTKIQLKTITGTHSTGITVPPLGQVNVYSVKTKVKSGLSINEYAMNVREKICSHTPNSPLCNKENYDMAQAIAYKKALLWGIKDKELFFRVGVGIINAESSIGTNYAGTCDSSYNNFGGIKWRILDDGSSVKDQKIPQGENNNCWLYKFNTIEDYFGSKYNSLGKGYGKCFNKKDPVHCISGYYVGTPYSPTWQKNVNLFTN